MVCGRKKKIQLNIDYCLMPLKREIATLANSDLCQLDVEDNCYILVAFKKVEMLGRWWESKAVWPEKVSEFLRWTVFNGLLVMVEEWFIVHLLQALWNFLSILRVIAMAQWMMVSIYCKCTYFPVSKWVSKVSAGSIAPGLAATLFWLAWLGLILERFSVWADTHICVWSHHLH